MGVSHTIARGSSWRIGPADECGCAKRSLARDRLVFRWAIDFGEPMCSSPQATMEEDPLDYHEILRLIKYHQARTEYHLFGL